MFSIRYMTRDPLLNRKASILSSQSQSTPAAPPNAGPSTDQSSQGRGMILISSHFQNNFSYDSRAKIKASSYQNCTESIYYPFRISLET